MANNRKIKAKKKTSGRDPGEWTKCPECGTKVRPKNLGIHMRKVHPKVSSKNDNSLMMARRRKIGMAFAAVLVAIVVVTASLIIVGFSSPDLNDPIEAAEVGDKAPLFTLQDLDGTTYKLADYVNKTPVILEFIKPKTPEYWEMWYPLSDFHGTYGTNLTIFTLIPEETDGLPQNIDWPTIVATPNLLESYGVDSYPMLVVVDVNGTVMYKGVTDLTLEALSPVVELAVKGHIEVPALEVGFNVGNIAPRFDTWDMDGYNRTLEGYMALGKPLYLEFFRVTCPACQDMTATLKQVDEVYGDQIQILSFSPDPYASTKEFIDYFGATWTFLWGEGSTKAFDDYFVEGVPTSFIIDTDGIIRFRHTGFLSISDLVSPIENVI